MVIPLESQRGKWVPVRRDIIIKYFLWTAGGLLLITGFAKVVSSFGAGQILKSKDPLTGLGFGGLMFSVGVVELAVAGMCLWRSQRRLATRLVAWLATIFLAYRFDLHLTGWRRPCPCLGNLTDVIHISPELADNIMRGVLFYLLVGSYAAWLWQWRGATQTCVPRQLFNDNYSSPSVTIKTHHVTGLPFCSVSLFSLLSVTLRASPSAERSLWRRQAPKT
jgi:hypothetical protein